MGIALQEREGRRKGPESQLEKRRQEEGGPEIWGGTACVEEEAGDRRERKVAEELGEIVVATTVDRVWRVV